MHDDDRIVKRIKGIASVSENDAIINIQRKLVSHWPNIQSGAPGVAVSGSNARWKILSTLGQLRYDAHSPLFQLDSNYLANTGLPDKQKVVLYCRPTFHEQFKFLRKRVIDEKVFGWILGPPGTGKSITALAFASTLDRNEWVVTWIHLQRFENPICVRLENDSKKICRLRLLDILSLDSILEDKDKSTKKHIVFVDGFVLNVENHGLVQRECSTWRHNDPENRRLVIVCSMSSRYKAKREQDEQLQLETFFVYSWDEQEYIEAVKHQEVFENVRNVLDTDLSEQPTPESLVHSKYYFAGGSARWMFRASTKTIINETQDSIENVDDIIPYIKGSKRDWSSNVINRLLSARVHPYYNYLRQISIVSRFAAAMLAIKAGPELIRSLSEVTRVKGNPSMNGWLLEMWFFANLCHGGVQPQDGNNVIIDNWTAKEVISLNVTIIPKLPDVSGVWFKPNKWNQGGYDAIYMDKGAGLVRFVQVTSASTHSFKLEYFYGFLKTLSESEESFEVEKLEIYFVVEKSNLGFAIAKPSIQGLLQQFGWKHGDECNNARIVYVDGFSGQAAQSTIFVNRGHCNS